MSVSELVDISVQELTQQYTAGRISPVEVLRVTLDHLERINPVINAVFSVRREEALEAAGASERRYREGAPLGLLDGVPVTVKDSIAMKGWPLYHGIGANRNAPPSGYDSPPAARLKEAGAVIFGKTTMPDCGLLASGVSSFHGVTRNPWNTVCNTGGSSAGAGASLAAGLGFLSVGSDIAGSVRSPAAHCGLASLKPSQGRIPHLPPDFMRTAGPMGRRVEDIAVMLEILSGTDTRDPWSLPDDGLRYSDELKRRGRPEERKIFFGSHPVRIGVLLDMGFGPKPEKVVSETVEAAGRALEEAGAIVEDIAPLCSTDAYAPIDLWLKMRGYAQYSGLPPHNPEDFSAYVRQWCLPGASLTAQEVYKALGEINTMRTSVLEVFDHWDYIISPALPMVHVPADLQAPDRTVPLGHLNFLALFNQTGQPASCVGFRFDQDSLPVGVQIVGRRFDDLGVLCVSRYLESVRSGSVDWPVEPRTF
jgi:Asp-tRNA(Asn)/Glu-tRNA(Gln) amidotransferase A subunit family amidase